MLPRFYTVFLISPTRNTFQVQAGWCFNLQEVFGYSALSCHQATCKLHRCFSIQRSSWLEDQSVSSPSPYPRLPVRLPGWQPRTRLPLLCAGFSSPHQLIPSHPHTHTLKCTVCKSAPRRATHLFGEIRLAPPNHPTTQNTKKTKTFPMSKTAIKSERLINMSSWEIKYRSTNTFSQKSVIY